MANEQLKNALRQAGMTAEQFAEIIQVDPKTVQRWIAGRTPYPRYRTTIAQALDLPEHQLWPDTVPPSRHANPSAPLSEGVEVIGAWGYLDDPGAPNPAAMIAQGDGPIDLLDNGRGIRLDRTLAQAIEDHASAQRPARILTCLPGWRLERLIANPHIQIIVIDHTPGHSLLRAGETMLLSFDLAAAADWPSPLLTLHRQPDGLFERLIDHFDLLSRDPEQIITRPEDLDIYRTNNDEDEQAEEDDEHEDKNERQDRPGGLDDSPLADQPEPPRRWPRQPPNT